jgi:hypothetical protein
MVMKIMPMKMMLLLIVVAEMIIIPAPTPPNVRPNVNVCYRCIYPGVFLTVRFPRKELSPKLQTNRKPRKQNATRIERMVKYVSETGNRTQKRLCPRKYSSLIKSKLLQSSSCLLDPVQVYHFSYSTFRTPYSCSGIRCIPPGKCSPFRCNFSFSISFPIITYSCGSTNPLGWCSKKFITISRARRASSCEGDPGALLSELIGEDCCRC